MYDLLLEVRTSAGAISGVTDKVISAEVERPIDDIGRLRLSVPVSDPVLAQVTIGRRLYLYYRNTLIAVGAVNERPTEEVLGGQEAVRLDAFLLFAELMHDTAEDSRWTTATALSTILGAGAGTPPGLLNGTGWTLSIEVGPGAVTAQHDFFEEDLVAAIKKVVDEAEDGSDHPLHWWADSTTKTLYVGIFGSDSGLRLAQSQGPDPTVAPTLLVESIEDRSTGEVFNSLDAWGGSAGRDRVMMPYPESAGAYTVQTRTSHMGGTICYIEDAASVTAYGLRRKVFHNNDANARNMLTGEAAHKLYFAACTMLLRSKDEHRAWIVQARGSALAALDPGDQVDIWYRGVLANTTLTGASVSRTREYNGAAYITKIVRRFDKSGDRYTLECGWSLDHKVGSRPEDDIGRAIATAVKASGGPSLTRMVTSGTLGVSDAAPANATYVTISAESGLSAETLYNTVSGNTGAFVTVQIATGAVAKPAASWNLTIQAETGNTDNFDTITGGAAGDTIVLAAYTDHTITVNTDTGNIILPAGDVILDSSDRLAVQYDGTNWVELSRPAL